MAYVGEIVHYVSYGTPGGEYKSECRAAIVTAVDTYQDGGDQHIGHVSLCVLNPTGMFFNQHVFHDPNGAGGTWHAGLAGPATIGTPCPTAEE